MCADEWIDNGAHFMAFTPQTELISLGSAEKRGLSETADYNPELEE